MFSLSTIIDDILLIVRNNNISESEDLSRAQIASWVLHHKAAITKQEKEKDEAQNDESWFDDSLTKTVGPIALKKVKSLDQFPTFTRQSEDKLDDLYENDPDGIIAVFDQLGQTIQKMHKQRRHFHYYRKYTSNELTYYYENGYIFIQGNVDKGALENIWIKYISSEEGGSEDDDSITIPGWMVPEIKNRIFKNELAFMIKMPSDDDNNSTLDGIKPHGPQDQEK